MFGRSKSLQERQRCSSSNFGCECTSFSQQESKKNDKKHDRNNCRRQKIDDDESEVCESESVRLSDLSAYVSSLPAKSSDESSSWSIADTNFYLYDSDSKYEDLLKTFEGFYFSLYDKHRADADFDELV